MEYNFKNMSRESGPGKGSLLFRLFGGRNQDPPPDPKASQRAAHEKLRILEREEELAANTIDYIIPGQELPRGGRRYNTAVFRDRHEEYISERGVRIPKPIVLYRTLRNNDQKPTPAVTSPPKKAVTPAPQPPETMNKRRKPIWQREQPKPPPAKPGYEVDPPLDVPNNFNPLPSPQPNAPRRNNILRFRGKP